MNAQESKPYYKIGEVCELTGTQPYVLRFWESEFPALAPKKNRSGQRIYRRRDIELIQRIKTLLYEEEYTIAGARKVLENDDAQEGNGDDRLPAPNGTGERPASSASRGHVSLPLAQAGRPDAPFEAEVRNLRAKLSHVENELKVLLADMERRDKRKGIVL